LTVRVPEDSCYDDVPQAGITVFEDRYCGGASLSLKEGVHDFSGTNWNDVISAITLAEGYSALISENKPGTAGGMRCVTGWMWDFAIDTYTTTGEAIDDTITSIEVMRSLDCNGWNPNTQIPAAPTITSPSTQTFQYGKEFHLYWTSVEGASYYQIELVRDQVHMSTWTDKDTDGDFPAQDENLKVGSYSWRVRAFVPSFNNFTAWSAQASFKLVEATQPTEVRIFLPLVNR